MTHVERPTATTTPSAGLPQEAPGPSIGPLRLLHHHPGYLRVQAAMFLETAADSPFVKSAQADVESVPGVQSWSHHPKTGTIVVQYDTSEIEADDLLLHIAKTAGLRGVVQATGSQAHRKELVGAFLDTVQGVNQAIGQLTGQKADLRELAPIALAATSVVSFVLNEKRGRLPEWSGALYHSYRVFMQWHRTEIRTRERAARQEEETGAHETANPVR
jgi:hypothetical protein